MLTCCPAEIDHILLEADEIAATVAELARRLETELPGDLVLVGVLNGASVFLVDLMRRLQRPVEIDFVSVSSYGQGAVSSGELVWEKDLTIDLAGRQVVLVEDIVDTGLTLRAVQQALRARGPSRLVTCALLSKPSRREVEVPVEFLGREIPDEFVVGYGLDYAQRYRNLPYIGVLKRDVYR